MKAKLAMICSILLMSTAAVVAENPEFYLDVQPDSVHPGDDFDLIYEVEDDEEIEVKETLYADGTFEVDEYTDTVTSGVEEGIDFPYITDISLGETVDYYGGWRITSELTETDSITRRIALLEVEPRNTLADTEQISADSAISVNKDIELYNELKNDIAVLGDISSDNIYDHDETITEDYEKLIVIGTPETSELVDDFSKLSGEVYSMNQYQSSDTSNLARIEVEEGDAIFLSGNSEAAVQRSTEVFMDLITGEINRYFENQASRTVNETEYEAMLADSGQLQLEFLDEPEGYEGEEAIFEIRAVNTHPTDIEAELVIEYENRQGEATDSLSSSTLEQGEIEEGEVYFGQDEVIELKPGQNRYKVEIISENFGSESIEREYQIGESDINLSIDILEAEIGESLETEIEAENLGPVEFSGSTKLEHSVDQETVWSDESLITVEGESERSEIDGYSEAEAGENRVKIMFYDSENEPVTSDSETIYIRQPNPEVSIEGDISEDGVNFTSEVVNVDDFEDARLGISYLKDGRVIEDYSDSVGRHGEENIEEISINELRKKLVDETGDPSIDGDHEFVVDVLEGGEVVGSDEDIVSYEGDAGLDTLTEGWTMISGEMGVDEVLRYCSIAEYQGEKVWQKSGGEWSHPEQLEGHLGYYVYVDDGCEAPLRQLNEFEDGVEAELEEGWNMISVYKEESFEDLEEDCSLVEDGHGDSLWFYDSADRSWESGGQSLEMEPQRGYFINVEEECSIEFGAVDSPPTPTGNFFRGEQ